MHFRATSMPPLAKCHEEPRTAELQRQPPCSRNTHSPHWVWEARQSSHEGHDKFMLREKVDTLLHSSIGWHCWTPSTRLQTGSRSHFRAVPVDDPGQKEHRQRQQPFCLVLNELHTSVHYVHEVRVMETSYLRQGRYADGQWAHEKVFTTISH